MRSRPFQQVDVFTPTAYFGNPVAVVLDAAGLDDDAMQRFARWTQLSETTFVLPPTTPQADYRVRIFTPGGELPFAGHPTLGTCHAWLALGGKPARSDRVVQECGVGLVPVRRDPERLAFAAPPTRRDAVDPDLLSNVMQALGLASDQMQAAQWLDNGPKWLGLRVKSPTAIRALAPDHMQLRQLGVKVGVAAVLPPAQPQDPTLLVRAFAAAIGIPEDPVTGSLNASLAGWLMDEGHMPHQYVASQGEALGRAGRVHVSRDRDGQLWVGGDCVTCIEDRVNL